MKGMTKNYSMLILLMLAGIVIGGFIGEYLGKVPYLSWLSYGKEFGLTSPFILDLYVIKMQFALTIRFTIAGIIGIILAFFTYRHI
ncbi:MAG: DUF4321 domain-containing protein [Clostridiales bacterium]|nr:DUF4321 domain-containing protein [Clostridiales bacterium]